MAGHSGRRRGGGSSSYRRSAMGYHSYSPSNKRPTSRYSVGEAHGNSYCHIQTVSHHPSPALPPSHPTSSSTADEISFVTPSQTADPTPYPSSFGTPQADPLVTHTTSLPSPANPTSKTDRNLSIPTTFAAKLRAATATKMLRDKDPNSPIDDRNLSPSIGPVSLGSYTTFKPASRSKASRRCEGASLGTVRGSALSSKPNLSPLQSENLLETSEKCDWTREDSKGIIGFEQRDFDQAPATSTNHNSNRDRHYVGESSTHPLREHMGVDDEENSDPGLESDQGVLINSAHWNPILSAHPELTTQELSESVTGAGHRIKLTSKTEKASPSPTMTYNEHCLNPVIGPREQSCVDMTAGNAAESWTPTHHQRLQELYPGGQIQRNEIHIDLESAAERLYHSAGALNLHDHFPLRRQPHNSSSLPAFDRGNVQTEPTSILQRPAPRAQMTMQAMSLQSPICLGARQQQQQVTGLGPSYCAPDRESRLKNLHGIAASSSARAANARTVMYDPAVARVPSNSTMRSTSSAIHAKAPNETYQGLNTRGPSHQTSSLTPFVTEYEQWHPLRGPSESLPWKDRPVEIFEDEGPARTDEQLRVAGRLMALRNAAAYNGHLRIDPIERSRAAEADATEWFHSTANNEVNGKLREYLSRHAEIDKHRLQMDSLPISPLTQQTPIGAPSLRAKTMAVPLDTVEMTNNLFVPLLANMHGYLSESSQAGHGSGAFGSFAGVPEWCVDTSRSGLNSFFGEDWGAPPARVGRDPRYRPVIMRTPRFRGGFEEAVGSPVVGSMGPSMQAMGVAAGWSMWSGRHG